MTKIINLYGGPGVGKSTSAAYIYYKLKAAGMNAELVREAAKDWAWEKRNIKPYDEMYITSRQIRRESLLYDKVAWIVTDSPIMMSSYYPRYNVGGLIGDAAAAMVKAFYAEAAKDGHEHFHVLLQRTKAYEPAGRYQTEEEARQVDVGVKKLLTEECQTIINSGTDEENLDALLWMICGDEIAASRLAFNYH